jgi:prepilin peptidase CpaA
MHLLCLGVLAGLLVVGALIDIDDRRLPNWLTAAVAALYALDVIVSPVPVAWMGAFAMAGLVFAIGLACYALQLMGGGDVKLLAALSLWAGTEHLALFLITTSLAGGVLAIVMLGLRRMIRSPLVLALSPFLDLIAGRSARPAMAGGQPCADGPAEGGTDISLPYGVAIAAGGFTVIHSLLNH